jgi:hypothetical protein
MEVKAAITSKDGVWNVKVPQLGIDKEIVPLTYDLSDLPSVLGTIEADILEKTRTDLGTEAPLGIIQTDLKIAIAYAVRSPRDRTFADFEAPAREGEPEDEAEPLELEAGETPLLEAPADVDALIAELVEVTTEANGGKEFLKVRGDEIVPIGRLVREMVDAGEITADDVRAQIAAFREGLVEVVEAVDGE